MVEGCDHMLGEAVSSLHRPGCSNVKAADQRAKILHTQIVFGSSVPVSRAKDKVSHLSKWSKY